MKKSKASIHSTHPLVLSGTLCANDAAHTEPSPPQSRNKPAVKPQAKANQTATGQNRSWVSIAATGIKSSRPTVHMKEFQSIQLPHVKTSSHHPVLTLAKARSLLSSPESALPAELAAARTLVNTVGPPIRLGPHTGAPERAPPSISSLTIAPDSSPMKAFTSFTAVQNALRQGALRSLCSLPPHVILPGVGRWMYLYFPAAAVSNLSSILPQFKSTYEDMQICTTPLPKAARELDQSAAKGVARRLIREAEFLRRRNTATSLSIPLRIAISDALKTHATAIIAALQSSAHPVSPIFSLQK